MTAAANALPDNTINVSISLLQAAFSHNGLSGSFGNGDRGFFRDVIDKKRISGPIITTHTKNDWAVGIAYPLASQIAGQNAAAWGDQNDPYGGMGRNGAQKTPEAVVSTLLAEGNAYQIAGGTIYNLEASPFIANHGDVTGRQVAHALLSSIATT